MASATVDYIGQDSSSQKVVKVKADAPGVDFIRKGMSEPAGATAKQAPAPKS